MAEQVGLNFLLEINDTLVGGGKSHTITRDQNIIDIVNKENLRWNRRLQTIRTHSTEFTLDGLEDGREFIARGNVSIEVYDGTSWITVPGVTESTFSMDLSVVDSGGHDKPLWRYIVPNRKDISLSFTANYQDPAVVNGESFAVLRAAEESGDNVEVRLTVAGATYTGDVKVSSSSQSTETDDIVPWEWELMSQGLWTNPDSGLIDAGQALLFDNYFSADPDYVSFKTLNVDGNGDPVPGATFDQGEGLITSLEISMPDEENVEISGTIEGHGPITTDEQATSA